ncbi:VWA domain-containing protein [Candidatus Poribacteria bacterium]|nr:VWA domain-containing protein [Candidatus Poribacteria bacterium]
MRNPIYSKQKSTHALLISLIIHLCFLITFTIVVYHQQKDKFEDTVGVEFVNEKSLPKPRRKLIKPPPPERLVAPRQLRSAQPQTVKLEVSANLLNETLRPSDRPLLHSATLNQLNPQDRLPDVTTATTKQLETRETQIPEEVSTRYQVSDGEGVKSFRQRVKGNGAGGLHSLESTGTADIGTVGDRPGKGGTGTGGPPADNSPFGEALRRIADHIIATRTKDKIDVVFVLDTSGSMQDNIQQVADHLYGMTDAYDQIHLEYYLGLARFSVTQEGQIVKIKSLTPDVGLLRSRMKDVRISGDEHALDALVDTLNSIELHSDADKHLVLVTDEPATTVLRTPNALQEMREKVLNNCKWQELHVNVLGHTEQFQKRLAEMTGGLWQEIPGGVVQSASLPASRFPNEKFIAMFREIVTDIRRNAGSLLFSMSAKFQVDLDDHGDILTKRLNREFEKNGISLSDSWRISESASTLVRQEGSLWVITDHAKGQVYTIRKEGNQLNVYTGIYPESWGLSEDAAATVQKGDTWLLNDHTHGQVYTLRKEGDKLNIYTGAYAEPNTRTPSQPMADIVIMLDYSRSMGGKSQAVMLGISTLIGRLDLLPVSYWIGFIRFAEAKDAIKSIDGAVVTQMPLNEAKIQSLMELPFGGDEHLIDAIVEGLPQVRFRPGASRFLLVLTDEPTTGRYPPERAIEVCQSLGIRAYVIGVDGDGSVFQSTLAQQTKGLFFSMPNAFPQAYPNQ